MSPSPWVSAQLDAGLDLERVRLVELFDAWEFAEATAGSALRRWQQASDEDRGDAYAAYQAALDREEQAAAVLQRALMGRRGLRYAAWLAHLA